MLIGGTSGLGYELARMWENTHDLIEINRQTDPKFDLRSFDKYDSMIPHLKYGSKYLPLDALVISAGMGAFLPPIVEEEKILDLFKVNTLGPLKVYQTALKNLLKSKGKVIFITSTVARKPGSGGLSIYAATKGAIHSYVISEGRRAAKHGIGMCAVAPGFFDSPMTDSMVPALKKATMKNIPFGRYGNVSEIADFIDSLLNQSNWTIAGSVFELSGGA
jgi:3-oxoacyl-[acyl-carrier protein] reductase